MMKKVGFILLVLMVVVMLIGAYTFLTWGIGSLFIYAFNIPYKWTLLKSLSIVLVIMLLVPFQLKGEINFDKS
jgi:hypothetical protein